MEEENSSNEKIDYSVSLIKANLYSIPIIIAILLITVIPYYLIYGGKNLMSGFNNLSNLMIFIPAIIIGIFIHEIIHALGWKIFGKKNWDKIKIGFQIKTLTPYAHCSEPVEAKVYRIGTILPAIILGIIPLIFSYIFGNGWLFLYSVFFIIAASGDFLILWLIRKVPSNFDVEDHPKKAGCFVYQK